MNMTLKRKMDVMLTPLIAFSAILMTLAVFLIVGCKVEDKTWIDKMLSEMEIAWVEADKASGGQEGRSRAATQAAYKYFRPGMPKTDALNLFRELKTQGFDIGEYRHEGAKNWLDGELKPYFDEATKKNLQQQIPQGTSRITAKKEYGKERLIISKHVALTIVIEDASDYVKHVEASIWTNSL